MTHLDLFSGIGGFALAAQWNELTTIGFSEIDPYAAKILKQHWPNVHNYGNIRNVRNVRADIVTGGFPCQPFSLAGKRGGAGDDRALWPEMLRVIKESKPAWVLGENVPGLISMELDRVLSDLETLDYSVRTFVIPACAVDARHRRDRVWIVANANSRRFSEPGSGENKQSGRTETLSASKNVSDSGFEQRPLQSEQSKQPNSYEPHHDGQIQSLADADSDDGNRRSSNVQMGRLWRPKETQNNGVSSGIEWLAEPSVGRVASRVPNRSHRLKGLGNAIVPQVAAEIIRMILLADKEFGITSP